MDFNTLSRRQLQSLCKKNKIPANITNVAMVDALNSLEFVEGIEEILNQSDFEIAQSPMLPPTGGRSRIVKAAGILETPAAAPATAARRRAAAASTSVRRKIEVSSNDSLDEVEEVKKDVTVKTPAPASRRRGVRETSTVNQAYSTRRSARLVGKIEDPKEISEAIKINSFTEVTDQSENSEITVLDNCKEIEVTSNEESKEVSDGTSEILNGDVAVASMEQDVSSAIKTETDQKENEHVHGLVPAEICVMETKGSIEDTKMHPYEEVKASDKNTDMDEEIDASIEKVFVTESNENETSLEDGEMKSNVEDETKAASIEMNSNMDEETEDCTEKVAVIDYDVNEASFEDGEMKSNVDEATKAVSIEEDTDMIITKDDEEIDIAETKGYMVDNFSVNIQETNDEEVPGENETSDDEESDMSDADFQEEKTMSEVEIQDELVDDEKDSLESDSDDDVPEDVDIQDELPNSEAKHEFSHEEMNVSEDADEKENIESSVIVEELKKIPLEEFSMRELKKMFKEKLNISKQQNKEDGMEVERSHWRNSIQHEGTEKDV